MNRPTQHVAFTLTMVLASCAARSATERPAAPLPNRRASLAIDAALAPLTGLRAKVAAAIEHDRARA